MERTKQGTRVLERGVLCGIIPAAGEATLRWPRLAHQATLFPLPAPTPPACYWEIGPPPSHGAGGCHRAWPHASTQGQDLGAPVLWPPSAGSPHDPLSAGQVSCSRRETESRQGDATWQCPRWGAGGRATTGAGSASRLCWGSVSVGQPGIASAAGSVVSEAG